MQRGKREPGWKAKKRILEFLKSDDPDAIKCREFLGDDVSMNTFSAIIVSSVGSMMRKQKLRQQKNSNMRRLLLTRLHNDMTKQRYIASVLFFGGRCCYCNSPMSKSEGNPKQATGEHLTPIAPSNDNDPVGVTRFGNMALACKECNGDRGNTNLEEWVNKTNKISDDNKEACLARIKAFRKYALYEEYSPRETALVKEYEEKVVNYVKSIQPELEIGARGVQEETTKINMMVVELEEKLGDL